METINHEYYVSPEVAKLLKEAGFAWECRMIHFCYVEDDHMWNLEDNHKQARRILKLDYCLLAPTLDVAQRWLREVKHLDISIHYDPTIKTQPYAYVIYDADEKFNDIHGMISPVTHSDSYGYFYAYEEAQESGIKEALEIILEKGE